MSLFIPKVLMRKEQRPKWFRHSRNSTLPIGNHIHSLRKKCKRFPSSHNLTKLDDSTANLQVLMSKSFESSLIKDHCSMNSVPKLTGTKSHIFSLLNFTMEIVDGIGPKLLKHCATLLYLPIHHLFSLCLSSDHKFTNLATKLTIS